MSPVQVWTLKGGMALVACFAAIRARRRAEFVGTVKAVAGTLMVTVGMAVTTILVIAVVARSAM